MNIRNRIKEHRRVRAGDLVPHELNYRLHPESQARAITALYAEVGFARSLLAYELPDGRLQLIDGHLRRDLTPDMEVDVEILDVTAEEARMLLLSIDPLAELAKTQEDIHRKLVEDTPTDIRELQELWHVEADEDKPAEWPVQFLVMVQCKDEREQRDFLNRMQSEGRDCRALIG